MFTEVNPDKGTETSLAVPDNPFNAFSLQKLTPIRGRKHHLIYDQIYYQKPEFTEVNPDKGTETNENRVKMQFIPAVYRS